MKTTTLYVCAILLALGTSAKAQLLSTAEMNRIGKFIDKSPGSAQPSGPICRRCHARTTPDARRPDSPAPVQRVTQRVLNLNELRCHVQRSSTGFTQAKSPLPQDLNRATRCSYSARYNDLAPVKAIAFSSVSMARPESPVAYQAMARVSR